VCQPRVATQLCRAQLCPACSRTGSLIPGYSICGNKVAIARWRVEWISETSRRKPILAPWNTSPLSEQDQSVRSQPTVILETSALQLSLPYDLIVAVGNRQDRCVFWLVGLLCSCLAGLLYSVVQQLYWSRVPDSIPTLPPSSSKAVCEKCSTHTPTLGEERGTQSGQE
jgi:hypothetical protein